MCGCGMVLPALWHSMGILCCLPLGPAISSNIFATRCLMFEIVMWKGEKLSWDNLNEASC